MLYLDILLNSMLWSNGVVITVINVQKCKVCHFRSSLIMFENKFVGVPCRQ